ncbi:MAG TPA: S41 family peptidase [Thermomicrobiaceae bacterium]|nr:S41 family peptidase [Thermomicrobiaceae bacterium]
MELGTPEQTLSPTPRRRRTWLRVVAAVVLGVVLVTSGFIGGLAAGQSTVPTVPAGQEPTSAKPVFNVFWQAWTLVQQHYVDRAAVNPTTMTDGAISGMLNSLGDVGHTRFLTPADVKAEQQSLQGQLEGIGAEIGIHNGQPTIIAPIPGAPAQKAGVRAGDVLVRVDGKPVTGLSLDQIVAEVRGPAGTSVTLTVIHPGQSTFTDITIVRQTITVPSVSWAILPGTTVAHILITSFSTNTTKDLQTAIKAAQAAGAQSIVLDLRNNPGGYVSEAIGVASQFIANGNVFIQRNAAGKETPNAVTGNGVAYDIPMVVLVNNGTASAAEIVAGALQDHQRAKIVGETTFGTGTVLNQFPLSDGSAILLGTEEWLTPNGHQIWHKGITPNVSVTLPANAEPLIPDQEHGMTAAQLRSSQDTQLLRALQLLGQPATATPTP